MYKWNQFKYRHRTNYIQYDRKRFSSHASDTEIFFRLCLSISSSNWNQVLHFNVHYWNGCVSLWVCVICFFVHLITQEPNIFRLHIINSLVSTLSISIQFNYHNNNYFRCSISDMVVLSLVSLDYIWLWTCRWLVLFLVFFVKIDSRSTFQCEINGDIYIYDTFLARKMGFWSVWRVHILRKCIEFHYFIAGP